MAQEKFDGGMVTEEAILVWPKLFTPVSYKNKPNAPKRFEASLLFTPELFNSVLQRARECSAFYYGDRDWKTLKTDAFSSGNKTNAARVAKAQPQAPYPFFEDRMVLSLHSAEDKPPEVIGADGGALTAGQIQGGEVVRASINISPYDYNGEGLTAYINSLIVIKPVGTQHPVYGSLVKIGGRSAKDTFSDYLGTERAADPSSGMNMDI